MRSRSLSPQPMKCQKHRKHSHRRSVEEKLDSLTSALAVVQQALLKQGSNSGNEHNSSGTGNIELQAPHVSQVGNVVIAGESETTVYRSAVDPVNINDSSKETLANQIDFDKLELGKRISTSSDEGMIDTSNELEGQVINSFAVAADAQVRQVEAQHAEPTPGGSRVVK